MKDLSTDTELEKELQELYILARHWLADLDYLEEELQFFKNILRKYCASSPAETDPQNTAFERKVFEMEDNLATLRKCIPDFLNFLAPFVENPGMQMDLTFLGKYNTVRTQLQSLFAAVRTTKKELFAHVEVITTKAHPVN